MFDFIHNAASGNLVLGERAAKCALNTLYGKQRDWKAPEVTKAVLTAPDTVELFFDRIYNWINPFDPPASLLPFEVEDAEGFAKPVSYETRTETLVCALTARSAKTQYSTEPGAATRTDRPLGLHALPHYGLLTAAGYPLKIVFSAEGGLFHARRVPLLLRFCCDPGFNDELEIPKLLSFVEEARVDDVMVFVNVEEINTGHLSAEEQETWLSLLGRIQPLLQERGVTLSVNHWHSLMHADLGKRFRRDQPFRAMVDPDGKAANLCVCPLDEHWRAYIAEVYAKYAKLSPDTVWVEDDFRYHNHDPLLWGGCFCAEHMRRFSERAGRELSREEFIKKLLAPGEPSHRAQNLAE
jgi:hypothetical protein